MARRTKDAPGRVTAKGTRPGGRAPHDTNTRLTTGRYTAPIPDELRSSPWWVPALLIGFMAAGVLIIMLDYLSLLPASPNDWYLLGGLLGIVLGFIVATRWH